MCPTTAISTATLWIAGELCHSDVCSRTSTSGRGWKMRLEMVTHCYWLIGAALFLGRVRHPQDGGDGTAARAHR